MKPINLPGTLTSLKVIRDYVRAASLEAGLDRKRTYRLSLAVDEIATNIITHGYEEAGSMGEINVEATISNNTLTIVIEDTAIPYDPLAADNPDDLDAPLEDRDIGGLGVFLAIQYVDEFRYERIADRNLHTFIMKANPPTADDGKDPG